MGLRRTKGEAGDVDQAAVEQEVDRTKECSLHTQQRIDELR